MTLVENRRFATLRKKVRNDSESGCGWLYAIPANTPKHTKKQSTKNHKILNTEI